MNFTPAPPAEPVVARATPLAKKVAAIEGVALTEAKGTGSHGKITRDDILAAVSARAAIQVAGGAARDTRVEPMSRMRKIIAGDLFLVREDRDGRTAGVPVVPPGA